MFVAIAYLYIRANTKLRMSKIAIIIQREYLSRVKKKSFIIMTLLGPILFSALMIVPIVLAMQEQAPQYIEVIDESKLVQDFLKSSKSVQYDYPPITLNIARRDFYSTEYTAILWVPENILSSKKAVLYYKKHPGTTIQARIQSNIEAVLYENQLEAQGIDLTKVDAAHIPITIATEKQSDSGKSERTNTNVNMIIGLIAGILIYLFIFMYGVQVMRGVIEEKTSRIVEVIISSVKPFQLMMGKIMGIALVGLTQFVLWVVLTLTLFTVAQTTVLAKFSSINNKAVQQNVVPGMPNQLTAQQALNNSEAGELFNDIMNINFGFILFSFLFYFLGGYLLYSALFAAVGSAVDSEVDTQQFMMPITLPLVLSFVASQYIIQDPEGPVAFWFSIIPLTSPIVMMVRLPFGVPVWEYVLSMGLLILAFIFTTWLASKIYRIGILMYGKKTSYKEMWKWIRYSS
jgi:ABC-2 type transport system permease protein